VICTTSSSVNSHLAGLRLVVTNTSRSWGGNEQYALMVASGLAAQGAAVRFLWSYPVVGQRVVDAGIDNRRFKLRADGDLPGLISLTREFSSFKANGVLLTRWREYLLGGIAARMARVQCTTLRFGLCRTPADDFKRRLIFSLADKVIVNAEEIRTALLERSWMDDKKIAVVHNGVDTDHFQPGGDGGGFRESLGISPEATLVLTVGSLNDQKNHEMLVRSAADVIKRQPQTVFVILGEGFLRGKLQQLIGELSLERQVLLPGFCDDIRPALAAADLFVLPSRNEGMARVLIEALACGKAIVTTDVSGSRSCVKEGENGFVVPSDNQGLFSDAILSILSNPELNLAMGNRSREFADENFKVENMLRKTGNVCLGQDN